jgi:transcriptional regulator with XRE-family HTH domain
MDPKVAVTLRTKKLGILIRDARKESKKSLKECGEAIGASSSKISSFEKGNKSPTLPELELLSYFLNVPISRFWKDQIKSTDPTLLEDIHVEHALTLRDRFIGNELEKNRTNAKVSYKDIREVTGITTAKMKKYEQGEKSIPLPELELLCNFLDLDITNFFDPESLIGKWVIAHDSIEDFLELPLDIQDFVSKPVNYPYLEIAQRLSEMSTEQLRAIAEGLLEITI